MNSMIHGSVRDASLVTLSLLAWQLGGWSVEANPTGGTVATGSATFNASGPHMTVTTGANNTVINWKTFNIGAGETTTFVEPSRSSVVWNYISDANPSQILGSLNANGLVVLQNQNGFYVGGAAAISTAGLIMTTAVTPPNLASDSAWTFAALPPTAEIINYGKINVSGGGPAFLIADNIENHGTIQADGGKVGLYAGKQVLVSTSADGRGLSAKVTLPEGSVDNQGKLIADGGSIIAQAKTVNQSGLIQANTAQEVNGTIELLASDSINLQAASVISAQGAATGESAGGTVTLKSDNVFTDQAGSAINVSGGAEGGNAGRVEISAARLGGIQTEINGHAAAGYQGGSVTIDPTELTLDDTAVADYNSLIGGGLSSLTLTADDTITLDTVWRLANASAASSLTLSAGNDIILNDGSAMVAGKNWTVSLLAGTAYAGTTAPTSGSDGLYLNGSAYVQTQNGNIHVWAANEVILNGGAIRTMGGGSIDVTAEYGDVNTGDNTAGYLFAQKTAPYYKVSSNLGGVSTGAGGDVTITAGGDVTSYLTTQDAYNNGSTGDAGCGAFGAQAGNVTITAGGSVYGNYVVANGAGTITAGKNCGKAVSLTDLNADFALSLVKGGWSVYAQNIYLDDVINPNGVFNDATSGKAAAGAHLFDYDARSSLLLSAAKTVEITGAEVPLTPASDATGYKLPVLLPPEVSISTGAGGLILDTDVILFPSANQNLNITTRNGGNFESRQNPNNPADINLYTFVMSDSAQKQFTAYGTVGAETFGYNDQADTPIAINNPGTVEINVSGSINDLNLYTTMRTDIQVGGDMYNCSFVGRNLHANDVTSIKVAGSVSYSPIYSFITLSQPLPSDWNLIFSELADPLLISQASTKLDQYVAANDLSSLKKLAASYLLFSSGNPGFIYNDATRQLGYQYQMSSLTRAALEGTLEMIQVDAQGNPLVEKGADGHYYFATAAVITPLASAVESLYQKSQLAVKNSSLVPTGFQIGGPGELAISAGSLDLGASGGIVSWGSAYGKQVSGGIDYASLAALTDNAGASINVTVAGDLDMLTSTIASVDGGNVTVASSGGQINLGLAGLAFNASATAGNANILAYGIYTAGAGDVTVKAYGDINIDTARIATFNGGNILVESATGDVNAGNGVNMVLRVPFYHYDALTGTADQGEIESPRPSGSGILAEMPTAAYQVTTGELPGNITVIADQGNIISTLGGISQYALNGSTDGGPFVKLTAAKDINLGQGGLLGGTVILDALNITGFIIARQNITATAVGNLNVTAFAGGTASLAGKTLEGLVVANGGINAAGDTTGVSLVSSSVSANGNGGQSTLGTATASAASQSAANQSGNEAKQELARNDSGDDDSKKKNKKNSLLQRTKRVTVLMPKI